MGTLCNNLSLNVKNIIVLILLTLSFIVYNIFSSVSSSSDSFYKKTNSQAYAILQASVSAMRNTFVLQENPIVTKLSRREVIKALDSITSEAEKQNIIKKSEYYKSSPVIVGENIGNKTADSKKIDVKYQSANPRFKENKLSTFAKNAIDKSRKENKLFYFEINEEIGIAKAFYAIKVTQNMLRKYGSIKNDTDGDGFDSIGHKMPSWQKDKVYSGYYFEAKIEDELGANQKALLLSISYQVILGIVLISLFGYILYKTTATSINTIKDGLTSFFDFLNKKTDDVAIIDIKTKDPLGEMARAVNENITNIKNGIEEDRGLIESAIAGANRAKLGFMDARINADTSNASLQELKTVINEMLEAVEKNIKSAMSVLASYSSYDYRPKINIDKMDGDIKALSNDINGLGIAITSMLIENKKIGFVLTANATDLLTNVDSLTASANNQASSLEETAAAVEEITSNMKNSGNHISKMTTYANEVSDSVKVGQDLATKTATSMDEINNQTNSIADAITVIDQIAFQTNILSLNAAVEAATAGEAGKGFAVVAQEVRNLAARSADAAKEIKDLVENATSKANEGKNISTEMIDGYNKLNENIHKTLELINNVSSSSKEQMSAMEQINSAVNTLDHSTQQNAATASSTNEVAQKMNDISQKVVEYTDNKEFEGKESIDK